MRAQCFCHDGADDKRIMLKRFSTFKRNRSESPFLVPTAGPQACNQNKWQSPAGTSLHATTTEVVHVIPGSESVETHLLLLSVQCSVTKSMLKAKQLKRPPAQDCHVFWL